MPFPATSMPDRDWWAALWPEPEATLRRMGIAPGMTVLDLCCGDGYFTAPLAKLVGGRIYGLDLDPEMIRRAEAEVARQAATVLGWICADAGALAERLTDQLDYVLLANTFHGVPDQRALVRDIRRVLRPDGRLGIVNWRPLPRERTTVLGRPRGPGTDLRMPPEAVGAVVEPERFRVAFTVDLPPYHYGIVFEAAGDEAPLAPAPAPTPARKPR